MKVKTKPIIKFLNSYHLDPLYLFLALVKFYNPVLTDIDPFFCLSFELFYPYANIQHHIQQPDFFLADKNLRGIHATI